jgi:hypothetical protein
VIFWGARHNGSPYFAGNAEKTPEVIIGCLKKSDIRLGIYRYYVNIKDRPKKEVSDIFKSV